MNSLRYVLCLVLFASSLGLAQTSGGAPLPSPPLVPAPASPAPLVPAPAQPEQSVPEGELIPRTELPGRSPSPRFAAGRVAAESLGGIVGGAGLGLGTALALSGLFFTSDRCDGEISCGLAAGILALPAVAVGIPLGVYITGGWMDGQGRFLPALGGMFAGLGAALLLIATQAGEVATLGFVILPVAGAVVGYELSHPDAPDADEDADEDGDEYASRGFQVTPLLGLTPRGGFMGGLSGRF